LGCLEWQPLRARVDGGITERNRWKAPKYKPLIRRIPIDWKNDDFRLENSKRSVHAVGFCFAGNGFRAYLSPWVAERPDDVKDPHFDYSRFNCSYWQKFERMLNCGREKGLLISVIFGWNDTKLNLPAGSAAERGYYCSPEPRQCDNVNVARSWWAVTQKGCGCHWC
jgi:hypothetical protein